MTASSNTTDTAPQEAESFLAMQERVKGTNINEQTLLATDYLNHFNEIIMLLEMVPDVRDCLEDAREWRPKSYQEHFRHSGFSDRELAVAAYDQAPAKYRELFEETVGRMNELVATSLARLEKAISGGEPEAVSVVASRSSRSLQRLVDVASAIIHGGKPTLEQDEIDALLQE